MAVWRQTCETSPSQQRGRRPEEGPHPDAEQGDGDGVNADAVSCVHTKQGERQTVFL